MFKKKEFPRKFKSSSAAYRAIRQHEEKHGIKTLLMVTKLNIKEYLVSELECDSPKITLEDFKGSLPIVSYGDVKFRYYPNDLTETTTGEGYYELKTGERRRPSSLFKTTNEVYSDLINEVCY